MGIIPGEDPRTSTCPNVIVSPFLHLHKALFRVSRKERSSFVIWLFSKKICRMTSSETRVHLPISVHSPLFMVSNHLLKQLPNKAGSPLLSTWSPPVHILPLNFQEPRLIHTNGNQLSPPEPCRGTWSPPQPLSLRATGYGC